jgi:prophage regulatory protein
MVEMTEKTLWRLQTVMARTGLPRSTIYHKMSQDEFPLTINIGLRSVAWNSDEVEEWIQDRIDESRGDGW